MPTPNIWKSLRYDIGEVRLDAAESMPSWIQFDGLRDILGMDLDMQLIALKRNYSSLFRNLHGE